MVTQAPTDYATVTRMQYNDTQYPDNPGPSVVPLGPSGNKWAVTAPNNKQSLVLYQRYGPIKANSFLEFDYAVCSSWIPTLIVSNTMSAVGAAAMQFRVDLVEINITNPGNCWFGATADFLVANVVSPQEADSSSAAAGRKWVHKRFNLTPFVGQVRSAASCINFTC